MPRLNKNSYWLKSGIYTMLERFSGMLLGFGSFFFLVRMLSKDDFGIWALFLTVTSVFEVARNGLIQNAQIKYLTTNQDKGEQAKISTASLTLNILLTSFSAVIILVFAGSAALIWEAGLLQPMFYIYTFTTILLIPFSQFSFTQQANFDFKGIFYSNLIRQSFLFIYIMVAYAFDYHIDLILLSWILVIAAGFGSLTAFIFSKDYLVFSKTLDWQWVKKLFHYGKFVFGTNVSSMFYKSIDQMMLGGLISAASVAIYSTAIRISNLVEAPTTSIASIVFPKSAKAIETEGKVAVKDLYEKSVAAIFVMVIPIMAIVLIFPEFVILIVAGEQYLDTVPILQVTILFSFFIPFQRQFGTVMDSIGKPKWNFFFVFSGALLNIFFNYVFIINMGTIGAAYGSLASYLVIFVVNQIILYKHLNIRTVNVLKYCISYYKEGWQMGKLKLKQKI